jgi:excisionase family DNA binding protein
MENPFEIIIEKLTAIERRLEVIESKLNCTNETSGVSEIMSLNQLCEYCDFTKSFVYKKTSTREIPHYKKGKKLFFKKEEIDHWIFENKVKTIGDLQREATKYFIRKKR